MAACCGGSMVPAGSLLRAVFLRCSNQVRYYAARKGTREKMKKKKKVKVEEVKVGFIPHKLRDSKAKIASSRKIILDQFKSEPIDDVWVARYHKWRTYSFAEAVQCHKETHHPTVYNVPDAPLTITFELDMSTEKQTKFVDNLKRLVQIPHPFNPDNVREVIAFCKAPQFQKDALAAGASVVGGSDLIRSVQNGEVSLQDFQYVVAHPDIMLELVNLKGIMKKRFPNVKSGNLGVDVSSMVSRFRSGIEYTSSKHEIKPDYGWIDVVIGKLDMETEQLEGNFRAVVLDVLAASPKRSKPFITRCSATSEPSVEHLKVDLTPYEVPVTEQQDDEQEELEAVAV